MTKRPRENMPADVDKAISSEALRKAYAARPPYQRNDYLRWIGQAKKDETRRKRIEQMIEELRKGDIYMGSDWSARSDDE